MKKRVAIIDMGTNTFHLLVADMAGAMPVIIHNEKVPVKMGKGGINNGVITADAMERAVDCIRKFKARCEALKCDDVTAFGTSAFRSATNGNTLARQIEEATSIRTKIISGEEEATLIYKGVTSAVRTGSEKALIVDIGGGSVEFIIADEEKVYWKTSLDIGGQRLLERFHHHDPILREEIDAIEQFLAGPLSIVLEALRQHRPSVLVGSSGTFDTLSEIHCHRHNLFYHGDQPETPLTFQSVHEIHHELITKNRDERMKMEGMIELRVDMIVVASCLVDFLLKAYSFQQMRVSTYSLKEGALFQMLETH